MTGLLAFKGTQKVRHFWTQSQGEQVLCAYGKKQERVFLCPGRQRGQKALYLGQTSLHSGRAQSLFYLCFLPPAPWEWSEQVRTHPLGGAVHHRLVPHQQLLRWFPACRRLQRAPKAQGFQQGDDRDRATQLSGDWGAGLKPVPCLQSHQSPVGRSRTGSVLGSTRAGWSCSPGSVSPLR